MTFHKQGFNNICSKKYICFDFSVSLEDSESRKSSKETITYRA